MWLSVGWWLSLLPREIRVMSATTPTATTMKRRMSASSQMPIDMYYLSFMVFGVTVSLA